MSELAQYMLEMLEVLIEVTPYGDKGRLERLFAIKSNLVQMIQEQDVSPTDGFNESVNKE